MLNKYKGAFGLTLWRWNSFQIELWFYRPGLEVPLHKHPKEDIEQLLLWGGGFFRRSNPDESVVGGKGLMTSSNDLFRWFSTPAGHYHGATIGRFGLVMLNFEFWSEKPTSAVKDFVLCHPE